MRLDADAIALLIEELGHKSTSMQSSSEQIASNSNASKEDKEVRNGKHKDEHALEIVVEEGDAITWKDNVFSFIGLIQDECDVTTRAGVHITMTQHNNATSMKKTLCEAKKQAYHTSQTTTPHPDLEQFTNGKQDNDDPDVVHRN